ncbi:MAG: TIM44-like domain-containing protein [Desulfovibrio sp.]|uniref:Tim44 domain-containing protein n=1 Tax=Desulfovibrio sp. TaxID=885 RepID=UPI0039E68EF1
MKFSAFLTIVLFLCCSIMLALPDSTEAARLGGGRSFGSKPFMSTPAQKPAMRQDTPQAPRQPASQAQAAPQGPRPGMFGGMGGLFGGLLAGTLLGSLLSGGGFAGGGFMDIILFGLLAFLALKLFARFRNRQAPAAAGAGAQGNAYEDRMQGMQRESTGNNGWDVLRDNAQGAAPQAAAGPNIPMPEGFDVEEFLRGAKMAYTRLQSAWDKRDMNDVAQFTSAAVQHSVSEQMEADPKPSTTELLLVNAQLLGVENEGNEQYAQVFFDVLMRESPDQQAPSTVREVWHFMRPVQGGSWKLDGIQQVE